MVSQPPPSSLLRPPLPPPPPPKLSPSSRWSDMPNSPLVISANCGGNKDLAVQVNNKRIKTEFDHGVIKDDPVDENKSMDKENNSPVRGLLNKKQSVQMNTFIDRRVSAEEFLKSLEEKW